MTELGLRCLIANQVDVVRVGSNPTLIAPFLFFFYLIIFKHKTKMVFLVGLEPTACGS